MRALRMLVAVLGVGTCAIGTRERGTPVDGDCEWTGDVEASDIVSFCNRHCARRIIGDLHIENTTLTDLTALSCLTDIVGSINISSNDVLTSLSGLESLTTVGTRPSSTGLSISGNDALTSLAGLEKLASIGGNFSIDGNNALASLAGLESLTSVGGDLIVGDVYDYGSGNDALTRLSGLEKLASIGGNFSIDGNDTLKNLSGLESLVTVGGNIEITNNVLLTNVASLYGLTSVGNNIIITKNIALTDVAARSLVDEIAEIGGTATIGNN